MPGPDEILACPCGGMIEVPHKGKAVCPECGMAGASAHVCELTGLRMVVPYLDQVSTWNPDIVRKILPDFED